MTEGSAGTARRGPRVHAFTLALWCIGVVRLLLVVGHDPVLGYGNNYDFYRTAQWYAYVGDAPNLVPSTAFPQAPLARYRITSFYGFYSALFGDGLISFDHHTTVGRVAAASFVVLGVVLPLARRPRREVPRPLTPSETPSASAASIGGTRA